MTATATSLSRREVPWASMGTTFSGSVDMTAEEAIERAGLDWEVELAPLYHFIDKGLDPTSPDFAESYRPIPDRFVVRRKDTCQVLGNVGSHYTPFNNRQAFSFCDHLVEAGEGLFTFAGKAKGGKQIVAVMRLPDDLTVAGGDSHTLYLLLRTSHDGTKAISIAITPIRHSCTNVMSLSLYAAGIKQRWSVPHVSTVEGKLAEARAALKLTSRYAEEYKKAADQLAATELTLAEFQGVLERVLPNRPKTASVIEAIKHNLQNSPNIFDEHRGTAWGGLNALTEYYDWKRDTRSGEAKFLATMDGIGKQVRDRATALLLARR